MEEKLFIKVHIKDLSPQTKLDPIQGLLATLQAVLKLILIPLFLGQVNS